MKVLRRHVAFSDSWKTIEFEPHSFRLFYSQTAENVTKEKTIIRYDRQLTVKMIYDELNLNLRIVHELMTKVIAFRKNSNKNHFFPKSYSCCTTAHLFPALNYWVHLLFTKTQLWHRYFPTVQYVLSQRNTVSVKDFQHSYHLRKLRKQFWKRNG